MAKAKKDPTAADGAVPGRALVDIPGTAQCGEFITLPAAVAVQLEAAGQFDPRAEAPK